MSINRTVLVGCVLKLRSPRVYTRERERDNRMARRSGFLGVPEQFDPLSDDWNRCCIWKDLNIP